MFERPNPTTLAECLYNWLSCYRPEGSVIALDGETICGSGNQRHRAYHVVGKNQLTLGEVTVEEKSNEITAVPDLLGLVDVMGSVVTADAMSCQKEIVRKIHEKKADYVIALKGNQSTLLGDAAEYFQTFGAELPMTHTLEKDHGRIENRAYYLETDLSWLLEQKEWAEFESIGMVKTKRICQDQEMTEVRYYLTSLTDVEKFAHAARKH